MQATVHLCDPQTHSEGKVFFEEVLRRFPGIEVAGEPIRTRSNPNNTYRYIPLRFGA